MNDKQKKILDFAKENNISTMSYREIAKRLNLSGPRIVIHHLEQLKKKGLIYYDNKRKVKVAKPKGFAVDNLIRIPIVGAANCGPATSIAESNIEGYLPISKMLIKQSPDKLIAVRAVGESLNQADINGKSVDDGDFLIVDCNNKDPKNGDYVLSIIDDCANFKKFYKDKDEIRLVSESTLNIAPITLHEEDLSTSNYFVNGVVVRVVKTN